ncbi:MAG: glycosyltransferase [Candidatus Aminicenantes bacterium]|nr:glycosyltransferase [Candidatus Aminicenantes bacterium]
MISVIIPTFNRAALLGEAITSVLEQEYFGRPEPGRRFELLVVDDGSEDETREVVESFGGRAALISRPHRGVSAARNWGLRSARGEVIAFLDSDDLWIKEKIGVQMGYFKAFPEAKVCSTEEVWLRRGKHLNPHRKHQKPSGWIFDSVLSLCLLSLSSCLFRREVFEEVGTFDESLPVCEDYDFGIRLAHRYPVHLIPRPLVIKRGGHPDQLSHRYWGMDRFRVRALEKALGLDLTTEEERLVREELARKCRILSRGFSRRGNRAEADRYRALLLKSGGGRDVG